MRRRRTARPAARSEGAAPEPGRPRTREGHPGRRAQASDPRRPACGGSADAQGDPSQFRRSAGPVDPQQPLDRKRGQRTSSCDHLRVEIRRIARRVRNEGGDYPIAIAVVGILKRCVARVVQLEHVTNDVWPDPSCRCGPAWCLLRRCRQGTHKVVEQRTAPERGARFARCCRG